MKRFVASVLAFVVASACFGDSIVSVDGGDVGRPIHLDVGQKLDVDLNSIGGYDVPAISTSVVRFIDVEVIPPITPEANTQRFHFVASASGDARIVFRRRPPFPGDSLRYDVEVR